MIPLACVFDHKEVDDEDALLEVLTESLRKLNEAGRVGQVARP
jgi:hypothetical protein